MKIRPIRLMSTFVMVKEEVIYLQLTDLLAMEMDFKSKRKFFFQKMKKNLPKNDAPFLISTFETRQDGKQTDECLYLIVLSHWILIQRNERTNGKLTYQVEPVP